MAIAADVVFYHPGYPVTYGNVKKAIGQFIG
jgi:hypothetical protein